MAKATIVRFDEIRKDNTHIFRIIEPRNSDLIESVNDHLCVASFENGEVTIWPSLGLHMKNFAELIAGCFDEKSNFATELFKGYDVPHHKRFTSIKFDFNSIIITVTNENADADKIFDEWKAAFEQMQANAEKRRLELEAMKTPE